MSQRLIYKQENINLLRTSIENNIKTNPDYGYSVKIDGLLIVPRTRNLELFDSFDDHITESTGQVVVMNFYGSQNKGEPVTFTVNETNAPAKPELSGTPVVVASEKIDREEIRQQVMNEVRNEALVRENERLKLELEEAKKVMREVETFVRKVRMQSEEKGDKGMLKLIRDFIGNMAVKNPDLLKEYPFISALASTLAPQAETPAAPPLSGTPSVTIKPKEKTLDEETEKLLGLVKSLRRYYSDIEFENILQVVDLLKDCKELLPHLRKWVLDSISARNEYIRRMQQQHQQVAPSEQEQDEQVQAQDQTVSDEKNETQETQTGENLSTDFSTM